MLRIITFDGGPGTFLQIRLLRALERRCPGFIGRTTLFGGVSSGALVALYLGKYLVPGANADEVLAGAVDFMDHVLIESTMDTSLWRFMTGTRPLSGGSPVSCLEKLDFPLRSLARPVTVLAIDMHCWEQTTFHPFPPGEDPSARAADVAIASGGFPGLIAIPDPTTYPGARQGHHIFDGSVINNNPSMVVLKDALLNLVRERDQREHIVELEGHTPAAILDRTLMASFGSKSGEASRHALRSGIAPYLPRFLQSFLDLPGREGDLPQRNLRWGYIQWLLGRPFFLPALLIDSVADSAHGHAAALLQDQYFRTQPEIPTPTWLRRAFRDTDGLLDEVDMLAAAIAADDEGEIRALPYDAWRLVPNLDVAQEEFQRLVEWARARWMSG